MKTKSWWVINILLVIIWFVPNSIAQDSVKWHLPEGTLMHLVVGKIHDITYTTGGTRMAVASSVGAWIYDMQPFQEVDLLIANTEVVKKGSLQSRCYTISKK